MENTANQSILQFEKYLENKEISLYQVAQSCHYNPKKLYEEVRRKGVPSWQLVTAMFEKIVYLEHENRVLMEENKWARRKC